MNSVMNRTYEMFVRVLAFMSERASSFPAGTLATQTTAELRRVVDELTGAVTTQTTGLSSAQRATAERFAARETLRETLQAVTRTARAMALDVPGLENKFRLPRSGSDPALLQAARAFLADALPLKEEFLRHEMPDSFLEDLGEQVAVFERAVGQQNTSRGAHVSATASVESAVERGMNAVRRLDAIVRNKYREDPAALAAWESARHVERGSHTRRRSNGGAAVVKSEGVQKA